MELVELEHKDSEAEEQVHKFVVVQAVVEELHGVVHNEEAVQLGAEERAVHMVVEAGVEVLEAVEQAADKAEVEEPGAVGQRVVVDKPAEVVEREPVEQVAEEHTTFGADRRGCLVGVAGGHKQERILQR